MWLLFLCAWGRGCTFNPSLWFHNLSDSAMDTALFCAVILVTFSYIISSIASDRHAVATPFGTFS
jgi:hypothetical protein